MIFRMAHPTCWGMLLICTCRSQFLGATRKKTEKRNSDCARLVSVIKNAHEDIGTIEILILNPTQSNCSHFGASLPPRETMEDQLQRLVEKGKAFKAKRVELLGKANPDETATSPTLEVDQIDRHVFIFVPQFVATWKSCLFSLDTSHYFGNPGPS